MVIFMKIEIPAKVNFIINNLQLHGHEAFVVGGCVRDMILGKAAEDWDVATSAPPEEIKRLFRRTIDTGIAHGTVTVLVDQDSFEVTTYRVDGDYEDHRHPKEVTFTNSLEEDLKRRDFTINAMAYNEEKRLVDPFRGMQDLNLHLIRCVGDPMERFTEDGLRILRALRFSAQLNFSIGNQTKEAIRKLAPTLRNISVERIQTELVKLLTSDHPEVMRDVYELGVTKIILPEWDDMVKTEQKSLHHMYDVAEHTIQALRAVGKDKILRLVMLFHDMGKPHCKTTDEKGTDHFHGHGEMSERIADNVLRRLKFDNDTIKKVTHLVHYHDYRPAPSPRNTRRAMNRIGVELFPYYLAIRLADTKAKSSYQRIEKIESIVEMRRAYLQILENGECVTLQNLAVNGHDLVNLGMEQGEGIGLMLEELLELVIDAPEYNTKEILSEYVKRKIG